jgi:hypothetical protein
MREELDAQLVKEFPRMFRGRYAPMTETAMCWGFECGDGWFDILHSLCRNIDSHIKWKRNSRAYDLRIERARRKGYDALIKHLSRGRPVREWDEERAQEIMENGIKIADKIQHVTVVQVKEKFGGLRFYYEGGDDQVYGMVRMAESWASVTCETCGDRGTIRHGGWIRTLCDKHEAEYQKRRNGEE